MKKRIHFFIYVSIFVIFVLGFIFYFTADETVESLNYKTEQMFAKGE